MTNVKRSRVLLLGALCLSLVQVTFAQTPTETASTLPRLVRFGGTAKDVNGSALTGTVGITFALYAEQNGGTPLWQEMQNLTADNAGHYSALLGSTKTDGLPAELFTTEQAHWVGVQVQGQPEQPRTLLVSTPYALKAVDAETIGGLPPSAFMLAAGGSRAAGAAPTAWPEVAGAHAMAGSDVTPDTKTKDYVPIFTSTAGALGNSVIYQSGSSIGVGTVAPAATLEVNGNAKVDGALTLSGNILSSNGVPVIQAPSVSSANFSAGLGALSPATTGFSNTAVGDSTLQANTTGGWNTATGYLALHNNTTGNDNTASGYDALSSNTSGGYNSAYGYEALVSNTTGGHNVAVGLQGLALNTTGSYNTASGYAALYSNTTASGSTGTGYFALFYNTASGSTATGYQALYSNTTGPDNTADGYEALYSNTTGNNNTAAGWEALEQNTTGYSNTAAGGAAMFANTTGNNNTATGYEALEQNTTGYSNTATGALAMFANTNGTNNTASGDLALYANTTGGENTAVGVQAMSANITGDDNTAVGGGALFFNTAGNFNTAIGAGALDNATGSGNTALGSEAGLNIGSTSNNIDIANQGVAGDSGVVRIGTAGTQIAAYMAGIYGVATSVNNAVPVMIDSNGQLGTVSSSRRYKEDIQDMADASSGLLRLRPVTFRYKQAYADGSKPIQYGLIAEEVAEVYPDLVARTAGGQIETVKYQVLDSLLLNELQKQNGTIESQREQIRSLEERLAKVEAALGGSAVTASR